MAREAGLVVKPYVSAEQANAKFRESCFVPDGSDTLALNKSLFFWDGLIHHFRFPFLKCRVHEINPFGEPYLRKVIEKHTEYPYRLIEAHLARPGRLTRPVPGLTSQVGDDGAAKANRPCVSSA